MLNIDKWHFDASSVDRHELCSHVFDMFDSLGYIHLLQPSIAKFRKFIEVIADNYPENNSYHNFSHVVNVMQFCYKCICEDIELHLSDSFKASLLLACLGHDIAHPGSNIFVHYERLKDKYGHPSSLEKHHVEIYTKLLRNNHIINDPEQLHFIAKTMLATDIEQHNEILKSLKLPLDDVQKSVLLIKISDLSQFCRGDKIASKWVELFNRERVVAERRKDPEGSFEFQISHVLSQDQFLKDIVTPLYQKAMEVFPPLKPILSNLYLLNI